MTMAPVQNGKQNYAHGDNKDCKTTTSFGAMNQLVEVEVIEGYNYNNCLGSDFAVCHMAGEEDESRANITASHHNQLAEAEAEVEAEAEAGSTSKEEEGSSSWLQLSIGGGGCQSHMVATATTNQDHRHRDDRAASSSSIMAPSGSGPVELELLPASQPPPNLEPAMVTMFPPVMMRCQQGGGGSSFGASSSSLIFEQVPMSMGLGMGSGPSIPTLLSTHHHQQHQEINWAFGHPLMPHSVSMPNIMLSSSSSISPLSHSSACSSLRPSIGSYFPTPFHHFPSAAGFEFDHAAGPSSDVNTTTVRVVDPPRRPHSGIWFMLQASQNQAKEPFLPQIPKSYLRIKDGRMTVRLLLKYLANKFRLESESEIEITCRGQQLLPLLTLQHVRDNIWTQRDNANSRTLLSDSSTTDHVMVLHYGRSA